MPSATTSMRTGLMADAQDLCRLIMVNNTGTDIFLRRDGDRWSLPEVQIPRFSRIMQQIEDRVRTNLGVVATHLFSNYAPCDGPQRFFAVLEIPRESEQLPGLSKWTIGEAKSLLQDGEDLAHLEDGCSRVLTNRNRGSDPFAQLGWIYKLLNWVQQVPGVDLITCYSQLSGSGDTCLMQLNTPTQTLWYKAVGQSDPKEFAITVALSEWLPEYLPRILAFDSNRNAWLMQSGGDTLGEQQDFEIWEAVVRRLAAMQISSLSHAPELLGKGCIDARVGTLQTLVRPFFDCMDHLMQQQVKNPPAPLTKGELNDVAEVLGTALSELAAADIPDVIGHSDFNPGNICAAQSVFLDWSAAHVGSPWLTLEYLIAHFKRSGACLPEQDTLLRHTFREQWLAIVPDRATRLAQELSPLIAVFASAAAEDAWRDPIRLAHSGVPGYLRSLTRIMRKEAQKLNARWSYA